MSEPETSAATTCPLSWPEQRRNLILFALSIGIGNYLAAPVLYIGITHAALCDELNADTATANLPATLFFAMTATPALIAWASPRVSTLKRNLVICYSCCAVMLGAMAAILLTDASNSVKIGMVILQGGVVGAVMPATTAYLWEVISRGTDESRRGLAMGMAFGAGPFLAVIGSFCQTVLIGGKFFFWEFQGLTYPWGFVYLFGMGVPMLLIAISCGLMVIIPQPEREEQRRPVSQVVGMLIGLPAMMLAIACVFIADLPQDHSAYLQIDLGGLRYAGYACGIIATAAFVYHFRSILKQRLLFLATAVTLLAYCGNMIPPNMNLYSAKVLQTDDKTSVEKSAQDENQKKEGLPAQYSGVQNTLRFSFKMVTGLFLGWLLTRTNPRAGILATSALFFASQIWAMLATGPLYLVAFGLYGAGELVGAYAPNYLIMASRKEDLRQTTAFMTLLMAPAAPVGYLYGSIVDVSKSRGWTALGMDSATFGFRVSFLVCAAFILSGIVLALIALPKTPRAE